MRHGIAATGQRAVACLGLLTPLGASAIDTTWIGAASDPFWDLVPNWSAGPPAAPTTRALLGGFDTTLRSGDFEVEWVQGTGMLTMTGGTLKLSGTGSSLGRLDLQAGALFGPGDLTLGQFRWRGGSLGTSYNGNAPRVAVSGAASIGGAVSMGFPAVFDGTPLLRLNGVTTWEDGNSTIDVGSGTNSFVVGATGVLNDHAATGNHGIAGWQAGLRNEGRYEKTGAGTTSMGALVNDGTMNLREGHFFLNAEAGSNWFNGGTLNVLGGVFDAHLFRSGIDNNGRIDVQSGALRILAYSSGVAGSGDWHVGPGGELSIDAGWGTSSWGVLPNHIDAGTWRSDGTLGLLGANLDLTLGPAARLEGSGLVEILQGAQVKVQSDVTLGGLRIGPAYRLQDQNGFYGNAVSRLDIAGALTVGMLDWSDGTLTVGGPVTVNGPATLAQDVDKLLEGNFGGPPQLGKRIDTAWRFNGGVTWDGRADLFGNGSIAIAAGTVFEDRNSRGTLEYGQDGWVTSRPTRIAVSAFDNAGTYLKTGAGATVISSAFSNSGTVRAVDAAGPLTFAAPLDNRGAIEAVRSRVVVFGGMAQAADGVLTGGRYVMTDGQIVLNLGSNAAGTAPVLLGQNAADVTLDGPRARLATSWMGSDVDALAGIGWNTGRIVLRNGAALDGTTPYSLLNQGTIDIGAGSRLSLAAGAYTAYQQDGDGSTTGPATWLGGTLAASYVQLGARFGAGGIDTVGHGQIDTDRLSFQGVVLDIDVADALRFDVVSTTGITTLDGSDTIVVDFDDPAHALGTYRVLTSDAGISGSFGAIESNLDAALYRVGAVYGSNYVDLRVSAVPEPNAGLLAGLGLLGLAGITRRRAAA